MSIHTSQYNDKEYQVFDATVPIAWSVCKHIAVVEYMLLRETKSSAEEMIIKKV